MDLQEVTRRVVLGHWVVIVAFVMAALGAVTVYHFLFDTPMYSASARVVLDVPAPTSGTEALSVGDTAKAIVTAPTHIIAALKVAGVERDIVKLTPNITMAPLGTSGVLLLTVRDSNPTAAASIANALADDLIQTRNAKRAQSEAGLDAQMKTLNDRITALNLESASLKEQLKNLPADLAGSYRAQILGIQITADDNESNTLTNQLSPLESELASLTSVTPASVIDAATIPLKADPSQLPIELALALIIGLVLGVGAAGSMETFRPTLATGDAVAKTLGVPVLGWLPDTTSMLPVRLKLAAAAGDVRALELIGISDSLDLSALARSLRGPLSQGEGEGKGLAIFSMQDAPQRFRSAQAPAHGFVLVTPERIRKDALIPVQELLALSGRPLLGLIAHRPARVVRTPLPAPVKPLPRLSVVNDQEKAPVDGLSREMESDLWGAQ
jgi:capsular polysaccharide biosynthesis protein